MLLFVHTSTMGHHSGWHPVDMSTLLISQSAMWCDDKWWCLGYELDYSRL